MRRSSNSSSVFSVSSHAIATGNLANSGGLGCGEDCILACKVWKCRSQCTNGPVQCSYPFVLCSLGRDCEYITLPGLNLQSFCPTCCCRLPLSQEKFGEKTLPQTFAPELKDPKILGPRLLHQHFGKGLERLGQDLAKDG